VTAGFAFQNQIVLAEFVGEFDDFESAEHPRTLAIPADGIYEIARTVNLRREYWITGPSV
jgi:hypothetical protein